MATKCNSSKISPPAHWLLLATIFFLPLASSSILSTSEPNNSTLYPVQRNFTDGNNGHDDPWSLLTQQEQMVLLHAYFTSPMPANLISCEKTEECPAGTGRCDLTWRICVPRESPHFPMTDGTCGRHQQCKPMYHCVNNKCLLTGPIACRAVEDCLTIPTLQFDCLEIANQLPGKRCWRRCSGHSDCRECPDTSDNSPSTPTQLSGLCRIPAAFRSAVVCETGHCIKKLPGDGDGSGQLAV